MCITYMPIAGNGMLINGNGMDVREARTAEISPKRLFPLDSCIGGLIVYRRLLQLLGAAWFAAGQSRRLCFRAMGILQCPCFQVSR